MKTAIFDVTNNHLFECASQNPPADECLSCGVKIKITENDGGVEPAKFCLVEDISIHPIKGYVSSGIGGLVCLACVSDSNFKEKLDRYLIEISRK
jgi:hypothetical protein